MVSDEWGEILLQVKADYSKENGSLVNSLNDKFGVMLIASNDTCKQTLSQ